MMAIKTGRIALLKAIVDHGPADGLPWDPSAVDIVRYHFGAESDYLGTPRYLLMSLENINFESNLQPPGEGALAALDMAL